MVEEQQLAHLCSSSSSSSLLFQQQQIRETPLGGNVRKLWTTKSVGSSHTRSFRRRGVEEDGRCAGFYVPSPPHNNLGAPRSRRQGKIERPARNPFSLYDGDDDDEINELFFSSFFFKNFFFLLLGGFHLGHMRSGDVNGYVREMCVETIERKGRRRCCCCCCCLHTQIYV